MFSSLRIPRHKPEEKIIPDLNSRRRIFPLTGLFVSVALSALLLAFFGSVFDHHYAERRPDHGHIYLKRVIPDHVHLYEALHTHFYTQVADSGTSGHAPSSDKFPNDIMYLSSYDGVGQVSTQTTAPSMHSTPNFPNLEDNHFTFDIPGDDILFQEAFIAPPKRPPEV